MLREQGFGGRVYFGLSGFKQVPRGSAKCGSERACELSPLKEASLPVLLFLGFLFFWHSVPDGKRGGIYAMKQAVKSLLPICWQLDQLTLTAHCPRSLHRLPASVGTEISALRCEALEPLRLIVTFIHPLSCKLRAVCKVRKIINHPWSAAIPGFSRKIAGRSRIVRVRNCLGTESEKWL